MTASQSDIGEWFDRGLTQGRQFMVVWCDTYDNDNYPSFYANADEVRADVAKRDGKKMQKARECYNLRMDKATQVNTRAWVWNL